MFTAIMGFHAKISDPAIGGTYMTLLNTLTNLGKLAYIFVIIIRSIKIHKLVYVYLHLIILCKIICKKKFK